MHVVDRRRGGAASSPEWSVAEEQTDGETRSPEREGVATELGSGAAESSVEAKRGPRRLERVTDEKKFHSTALGSHFCCFRFEREFSIIFIQ